MGNIDLANSNAMVAAGLALITIVISNWDVLAAIKNRILYWTLMLAVIIHLAYSFGCAFISRDLFLDSDSNKYFAKARVLAGVDILAWFFMLFHTCYRSVLIMNPRSKLVWLVPIVVVSGQLVIQYVGLKFWYDNWLETHFQSTTVQFFWLSLATIIYISAAETIFFVLSQITIIQALRQGSKVPLSPWHVVKIVLRSLCYIAAVFMQFVTLGGYFFPSSSAVIFVFQAPNLMILILLSDSVRIQEIVEHYSMGKSTRGSRSAERPQERFLVTSSEDSVESVRGP